MKLIPVSLVVFHRTRGSVMEVWTQVRTDDGVFHGLLEFPGGGIEPGESPMDAAVREVAEEVGLEILHSTGVFFGTFTRELPEKTILLYVHLFPAHPGLDQKGVWLPIESGTLSVPHEGKIPGPNHRIIDDLYRYLYDESHEQ